MRTYLELRNKLILDNIVIKIDNVYIFQSDYVFKSPSAASAATLGRPSNGWTDWKEKMAELWMILKEKVFSN